jgi:hypothetical protein
VGRLTHAVFKWGKIDEEWGRYWPKCGDAHDLSDRATDGIYQDKNI